MGWWDGVGSNQKRPDPEDHRLSRPGQISDLDNVGRFTYVHSSLKKRYFSGSLAISGYKRTEVYNLSNLKTHYEVCGYTYIQEYIHTYILPVCNEDITCMYVHTKICIYLEGSFE